MWPPLYNCGESVLISPQVISQVNCTNIAVTCVYPWGDVIFGSSYFAILALTILLAMGAAEEPCLGHDQIRFVFY